MENASVDSSQEKPLCCDAIDCVSFMCDANVSHGRLFRVYSVWPGVLWIVLYSGFYLLLLVFGVFGNLFAASLDAHPIDHIVWPTGEIIHFSEQSYYAHVSIRPRLDSYPVSMRWTNVDTGEYFSQIIGIASHNYSLIKRQEFFPFGSEKQECSSFASGGLPAGNYKLDLFYDTGYVRHRRKSSDSHVCDPYYNSDTMKPTYDSEVPNISLKRGEIVEFSIRRGVSLFLYDMSTRGLGWVYYFVVSIAILSQYYLKVVFKKSTRFHQASWLVISVILGTTIAYGRTLPSKSSLPLFVISIIFILVPLMIFLYILSRILSQRKMMDLIEYESTNRYAVFLRQVREVGFRTETTIRAIIEPKRHSANEGPVYKYYCPICMLYMKEIMRTSCCDQYICEDCLKSYLIGKGALSPTADFIPPILPSMSCLYCTQEPFQVTRPKKTETTKSYQDETIPGSTPIYKLPALRIGDSFETMKQLQVTNSRAKEPIENVRASPATDQPIHACPPLNLPPTKSQPHSLPDHPSRAFLPTSSTHKRGHTDDSSKTDSSTPQPKHILPPIRRTDFGVHPEDYIRPIARMSTESTGSLGSQAHQSDMMPSLPNALPDATGVMDPDSLYQIRRGSGI